MLIVIQCRFKSRKVIFIFKTFNTVLERLKARFSVFVSDYVRLRMCTKIMFISKGKNYFSCNANQITLLLNLRTTIILYSKTIFNIIKLKLYIFYAVSCVKLNKIKFATLKSIGFYEEITFHVYPQTCLNKVRIYTRRYPLTHYIISDVIKFIKN